MQPLVTVLMSVYNDEAYLSQAIDSVLGQTFTDFEFLIINDGSTDRSPEIIKSYADPRIRVLNNTTNIGLTKSLNLGLRAARADLIARLDANDVAHTDRLFKQVAFMKENRHVNVLGAQMQYINIRGRRIGGAPSRPVTQDGIRWHLLFLPPVNHPTITYRRHAILEELNGYNEDFQVAQDAELWSRVAGKSGECSIANLREVLVDVRYDPKSITQNILSPRRRGHIERMTTLLTGNAVRLLGEGTPYGYANQWMSISAGTGDISAAYGLTFLSAIKILHATYCKQYPSGAGNSEVNQFLKDVVFLTAYRLAESETMAARKASLHILLNELHRFGFADIGWRTLRILLLCAGLKRLRSLYRQIQQSR